MKTAKPYANRTITGWSISKNRISVFFTLIFASSMLLAQPQWQGVDTLRRELQIMSYKKVSLDSNAIENSAEQHIECYKNSAITLI